MSLGVSDRQPLRIPSETLAMSPAEPPPSQPLVGMSMITGSALLFGVVAAFVKGCALPALIMLEVRSLIELVIGAVVIMSYLRSGVTEEQARRGSLEENSVAGSAHEEGPPTSPRLALPAEQGSRQRTAWLLTIGPRRLWPWLTLRALLYGGFNFFWWQALTSMPIGDATSIVYTGQIFTALFAFMFLGESIHWSLVIVIAMDLVGLVLITQPSFVFPASGAAAGASYWVGAISALMAAVVSGLLPVTTRLCKECFWTAVNTVSSMLTAAIWAPLFFVIWYAIDHTAYDQSTAGFAHLNDKWYEPTTGVLGPLPCLIGATLFGFLGLGLQTMGYQRTEVTTVSVMSVMEIPFAYVLQYNIFGQAVTKLGMMGVALIMGGTLLNLLCQGRRGSADEVGKDK